MRLYPDLPARRTATVAGDAAVLLAVLVFAWLGTVVHDGVVAWQSCLDEASPWTENVEVRSSHCGMGHHPGVLLAIAERLARPAR